jgi:hypothetical protein
MRKHYFITFIILSFLILFARSSVNAQSDSRFVIRIPFDFIVPSGTLPAGTYAVERVDPTKPNVLMFKNIDSGRVRLFITQRVEKEALSEMTCLIFRRWKSDYQLYQVWVVGNKEGRQLPSGNARHPKGTTALVQLKVNDTKP